MPRHDRLLTPAFALVLAASLAYFMSFTALLPVVPFYVEGPLGGGALAVGLVAASFSLSALALRPWAARVANRRGRSAAMAAGAGVAAVAAAGALFAPSLELLVALRVLAGVGEALFFVGAATAVGDLAPVSRSGEALSWFSLTPYIGLATGPALGEAMLELASGSPASDPAAFTIAWTLSAGLAGLSVLIAARVGDTRPPGLALAPAHAGLQRSALFPGAVLLTAILGLGGFNAFAALRADEVGLSSSAPAFASAAVVLIAVRTLGASLPDRLGPERCAASALAGACTGLAVIAAWSAPAGLIAGAAIFGAGQALAFPALMAMAVRAAGAARRAGVVATMTIFIDLGFGLGPLLGGAAGALLGPQGAFAALAAAVAGGLVGLVAARRRFPGRAAASAPAARPATADAG